MCLEVSSTRTEISFGLKEKSLHDTHFQQTEHTSHAVYRNKCFSLDMNINLMWTRRRKHLHALHVHYESHEFSTCVWWSDHYRRKFITVVMKCFLFSDFWPRHNAEVQMSCRAKKTRRKLAHGDPDVGFVPNRRFYTTTKETPPQQRRSISWTRCTSVV